MELVRFLLEWTMNAVIDYRNDLASDTVSWSNWRMRKQAEIFIVLTLWFVIWVPATLRYTLLAVGHKLPVGVSLVFIPLFWLGVGLALLIFLRLFLHETIRVRDDRVILTLEGLGFQHTRELRREHIWRLSLETLNNEVRTLNLFVSRGAFGRRILLAYTVRVKEKAALYEWLKSAMERRGYSCEFSSTDERRT